MGRREKAGGVAYARGTPVPGSGLFKRFDCGLECTQHPPPSVEGGAAGEGGGAAEANLV